MNNLSDLLMRSVSLWLCLGTLLIAAEDRALALDSSRLLTAAGNKIINELQHKDFVAFDRDVSSKGLLIVRREPDWDQSNVLLKDAPVRFWPQGDRRYLSFNGMKTVVWKEYEISFDKPDLSNPYYLSLLKQFRGLILASQRDYHELNISLDTEDGFWFYERRLGPTIFGKLASDECLYIYLKRESGKWKVWRMEFWERGAFQRGNK